MEKGRKNGARPATYQLAKEALVTWDEDREIRVKITRVAGKKIHDCEKATPNT